MGSSCGEYHGRLTPWVSRRGPMQHPVKIRDWGKRIAKEPGATDLPEGRTRMMMMMMMILLIRHMFKKSLSHFYFIFLFYYFLFPISALFRGIVSLRH